MHIKHFGKGLGFVAHKYRIDGSRCSFSVWFSRDGHAIDAERVDAMGRSYSATDNQWEFISKYRIAGLECESMIDSHRDSGRAA